MATQKSARRNLRWSIAIVLIALAAAFAWLTWGIGLRGDAIAGSAYGAHVACSCRYIEGRSLADCEKDKLAGMELVHFSEDPGSKSITASVPLLASDTATYRPGYGCLLKPWKGGPVG